MPIKAVCPKCQTNYRLPESAAGKSARCKKCGASFKVPVLEPADDDELLAALIDDDAEEREADEPDAFDAAFAPKARRRPAPRATAGSGPRASSKRRSSRGVNWLAIGLGGAGVVALMCCGGGYFLFSLMKPPVASAQAGEPYPLETFEVPAFPELPAPQIIPQSEVAMYLVDLGTANPGNTQPAARTQLRIYLPPGEHAARSLGCVLVGPAGTNLLTGNSLDDPTYHEESLPYARAGYVAVTYSLDGPLPPDSDGSNTQDLATAYRGFSAAYAGLANSRAAFEFVVARLPQVDPGRVFAAGHSSAGTLALLFAGHEPRLKGCMAYAPAVDVEKRLSVMVRLLALGNQFPGIVDFTKRSSPRTHLSRIKCPAFLFWAADDDVVDISDLQQFAADLGNIRQDVKSRTVPAGGHYDTMINPGIPSAIEWLRTQPGE